MKKEKLNNALYKVYLKASSLPSKIMFIFLNAPRRPVAFRCYIASSSDERLQRTVRKRRLKRSIRSFVQSVRSAFSWQTEKNKKFRCLVFRCSFEIKAL
jgi:hypothetical protein